MKGTDCSASTYEANIDLTLGRFKRDRVHGGGAVTINANHTDKPLMLISPEPPVRCQQGRECGQTAEWHLLHIPAY